MIWISIAWRNLSRQGRRSLITASAMAVSVGLCMSTICLNDGTYEKLFDVMVVQQLGHVQLHNPKWPGKRSMYDTIEHAEHELELVDGIEGVAASAPRLLGYGLIGGRERSAGAQLVGIDPTREPRVNPIADRIKQGAWLAPDDRGGILIGVKLAEDLGVALGDEVVAVTQASDGSMGNVLFTVKGLYRSGDTAMDRAGGYVLLADLQELLVLEDQIHQITVLAADPDDLDPVVARLEGKLPELLVRPWQTVSPQTAQMLGMQDAAAVFILGIVFLVASFGVVNTMLVSVFERTTEFGVMRALGVSPRQLVWMVVVEAVLLGCMAAVGGLALGLGLDGYLVLHGIDLSASMEGGFDFNGVTLDPVLRGAIRAEPILTTIGTLIAVSGLAAVYPAWRAASIQPVDAIRAE